MDRIFLFPLLGVLVSGVCCAQKAEFGYSAFTNEQIAKHLGLDGGNWEVAFEEEVFLGLVVTETSVTGEVEKRFHFSPKGKLHQLFLKHHEEDAKIGGLEGIRDHLVEVGFSVVEDEGRTRGYGIAWVFELHRNGKSTGSWGNGSSLTIEEPLILWDWDSEEGKQAYRIEIVATRDKQKFEQERSGDVAQ